jgi:hypothetical protein
MRMMSRSHVYKGTTLLGYPSRYVADRPPTTVDEARDLWCRICNLMDWLHNKSIPPDEEWPKKYAANLHRFLGYWRHTPHEMRQTAKVLTRLG